MKAPSVSATATASRSSLVARALCRPAMFRVFERFGIHLTPVHFYQPIPDTRDLRADLWADAEPPPGLRLDEDAMEALLDELAAAFADEYNALPRTASGADAGAFHLDNNRFESVDAEMLYGLLRKHKPARMVEIGSGYSTRLAIAALAKNAADGSPGRLVTIDPFPSPVMASLGAETLEIRAERVQDTPMEVFAALASGDILFIDSSHVSAIGSDVNREILEILPRLAPGVLIHFHDIFLPTEYPREWVLDHHRFWTEQYLLQAFLAFNDSFEIVFANHWMHRRRPGALRRAIASYDPATVSPGSIWITRVR